MKFKIEIAKKHFPQLLESSTDAELKAAFKAKLGELRQVFEAEKPEPGTYKKFADSAEEMAKHFEDAYEGDNDGDGKDDHVVMRRMATTFRKLAKMEEGEGEGGEKKKGDEEKAKMEEEAKMEQRLAQEYSALAQRLKIQVPTGATSKQIKAAIDAQTMGVSEVSGLVEQRINAILLERDKAAKTTDLQGRARFLVDSLDVPKERAEALFTFATTPGCFEQAVEACKSFPLKKTAHPALFERVTMAGNPLQLFAAGLDPRRQDPSTGPGSGADRRIVENELGTFVVDGEQFSKMAIEWAEAKEGPIKEKIDAQLNDNERTHGGMRLLIANRLLKKERPELWERAEKPQLFGG